MTFETAIADQQPSSESSLGGPERRRRTVQLIGIFTLVVAAVAAFSWLTRSSQSDEAVIDENVSRIEVDVTSGEIEIIGVEDGPVHLVARTDDGWVRSARVTHDVSADTLRVEGDCRGARFLPSFGCRTDVTLTVPAGVDVVARAAGGSIAASNLQADARLESSAGDITVGNHTGSLIAHSSAGDVTVTGLRTEETHATSSAGSVSVEADSPPRSLDAESSSGAVSVVLPPGDAYDIEAKSRTDQVTVTADHSHASTYKVRAFSTAGPVDVSDR